MIIILMGMSAVGKDAIQKEIEPYGYNRIVSTTTRPKREKEVEGKDYFFVDDETFFKKKDNGDFIESREYNTIQDGKPAVWRYAAPEVDASRDWVIVLDRNGANDYIRHYGKDKCFTVLVKVSDETRRKRAETRGSFDLQEWNRRLVDDKKVFADVKADLTVINEGDIKDTVKDILDAVSERRKHRNV